MFVARPSPQAQVRQPSGNWDPPHAISSTSTHFRSTSACAREAFRVDFDHLQQADHSRHGLLIADLPGADVDDRNAAAVGERLLAEAELQPEPPHDGYGVHTGNLLARLDRAVRMLRMSGQLRLIFDQRQMIIMVLGSAAGGGFP